MIMNERNFTDLHPIVVYDEPTDPAIIIAIVSIPKNNRFCSGVTDHSCYINSSFLGDFSWSGLCQLLLSRLIDSEYIHEESYLAFVGTFFIGN
jgi:hypothetical protein